MWYHQEVTVYKLVDIRCLRLPFFDVLVLALDISEPIRSTVRRYYIENRTFRGKSCC